VVISGHKEAIDRALVIAAEKGFKRSVILPVSAPFHCALMQSAADKMRDALDKITIKTPVLPIMANVTASLQSNVDSIKKLLVEQVTGTVRWRESIMALKEKGVEKVVEVGSGTVLSGLMKRIDKEIAVQSIHSPADIEAFIKTL
jgi:[acyl-carrier-protein] S-malonyltransferase